MEPEDRRLLTDIHGIVSGLKPVIDSHGESLKFLDVRTRSLEVGHNIHDVKIIRLQEDLNGLGSKKSTHEPGITRAVIEFLAAAPVYAHVAVYAAGIAVTAVAVLWKHWPR